MGTPFLLTPEIRLKSQINRFLKFAGYGNAGEDSNLFKGYCWH